MNSLLYHARRVSIGSRGGAEGVLKLSPLKWGGDISPSTQGEGKDCVISLLHPKTQDALHLMLVGSGHFIFQVIGASGEGAAEQEGHGLAVF
jgi:hypothetical protein